MENQTTKRALALENALESLREAVSNLEAACWHPQHAEDVREYIARTNEKIGASKFWLKQIK